VVALKKPQGIYANEATHAQVSRLVENALDEHGTLAGFIDYIEQALWEASIEAAVFEESPETESHKAVRAYTDTAKDFTNPGTGPTRNKGKSVADRLAIYEESWVQLSEFLPWTAEDSKAHAFGLHLLTRDPRLWEFDSAHDVQPLSGWHPTSLTGLLQNFVQAGKGKPTHGQQGKTYPVIWRGDTLEVILDEPKAKSTSFYLETEAHGLTINLFGRGFFERVERGLRRILDNEEHWIPHLEPHFRFLEHGLALLEYEPQTWSEEDAEQLKEELERNAQMDDSDPVDQEAVTRLFTFGGFSWQAQDMLRIDVGYRLSAFQNALLLAHHLGVVDLTAGPVDLDRIRTNLPPIFLERYGLHRLGPERALAYRVIRNADWMFYAMPNYITNAVDYHLLKLFQAYALQVLPSEEQQAVRIHPATLATLSQPWVFPTRTTLEWYSNTKVQKVLGGTWQLNKSKKTLLELSDQDSYHAARALNAVFTTQPSRTKTADVLEAEQYFNAHYGDPNIGDQEIRWPQAWAKTVNLLQERERVTFRRVLSPALISRTRDTLDRPRNGSRDAIGAGLVLMAELADELIAEGNGQFLNAFLQRVAYDVSPFLLLPPQEHALRSLIRLTRGHEAESFERATNKSNSTVWAYANGNGEQFLENTFSDSMRMLAMEHAGAPEGTSKRLFDLAVAICREDTNRQARLSMLETQAPAGLDTKRLLAAARLHPGVTDTKVQGVEEAS
jgi:hypothetical protein